MLSDEQIRPIRTRVRQIQFAAIVMLMLVLALLAILLLTANFGNIYARAKMLAMIAVIGAAGMFGMAMLVPKIFGGPLRSGSNDELIPFLLNSLSTESMIRFALLEGAVFLNLLVFMLEPHILPLAAAGIGLLLMLVFFPRLGQIRSAIERRLNS